MNMADNKKYYYMRLNENYFDSETQVLLESMPDGYLYSNILLKLYLKSLKNDGRLMFNDKIPYSPQMIATITRHQVGTVEKALNIFKELNIIDLIDTGAIYMLDIQNFIGKSNTEADRKRAYRKRIETEKGQMSLKCPLEIEKEIELEIEKEIDIDNKPKNKTTKKSYGEYKRVKLTDKEYEKLCEDFDKSFIDNQIMLLDEYVEGNNNKNKYTNFNLVLRKSIRENWFQKNGSTRKEIVPTWIDKEVKEVQLSEEEQKKLEDRIKSLQERLGK
jgi:predicted phage replisome organizer